MIRRIVTFWDSTSLYLNRKVYYACFGLSAVFVAAYFYPAILPVSKIFLFFIGFLVLVDAFLLYRKKKGLVAERDVQPRLSIGDENAVVIRVRNQYDFKITYNIIEELPSQFQEPNWKFERQTAPFTEEIINYALTPKTRGVYDFGAINVYAQGPLGLVSRRYIFNAAQTVKVYPSFLQMRRYQLIAVGNKFTDTGVKRIRKLGHSMEFEQIKEYVRGDDYRTINWKATARRGDFMVNNFTDERSQQIYCVVNKGRVMKMPFKGMTLLDYAINASLVLCNVALQKQDKAGMITFSQHLDSFIQADKKPTQINQILEALYKQETNFMEPDFEKLFSIVRNRITHRSLMILFTNFETYESLQRELPSLKRLAHYHLLMVVFFDNTELAELATQKAKTTEDIYIKTIAEKYRYEKQLIAKELQSHGIIAVMASPENLTVNSLNKYLELKNRQSI